MFEEYSDNGFVCQCKTHGFLCVHKKSLPFKYALHKKHIEGKQSKIERRVQKTLKLSATVV